MTVFPSLFTSKLPTVAPHGMVFSGDKENFWQILKTNIGEAIKGPCRSTVFLPFKFCPINNLVIHVNETCFHRKQAQFCLIPS